MLDVLLQLDLLRQLMKVSIDADTDIAAFLRLLQDLFVPPLPSPHHGSQKLDPCALRQLHDLVHHLVHGLLFDLPSAFWTVGDTDAGVQKAHVIVDLCHCSHRGTRVSVGGFLVDGDRRGKSLDALHIGLFHLPQELAGIGRKGFHISSLPLGVDRIKGQRGFSRAGKAG